MGKKNKSSAIIVKDKEFYCCTIFPPSFSSYSSQHKMIACTAGTIFAKGGGRWLMCRKMLQNWYLGPEQCLFIVCWCSLEWNHHIPFWLFPSSTQSPDHTCSIKLKREVRLDESKDWEQVSKLAMLLWFFTPSPFSPSHLTKLCPYFMMETFGQWDASGCMSVSGSTKEEAVKINWMRFISSAISVLYSWTITHFSK